jgi:hypothetical protein
MVASRLKVSSGQIAASVPVIMDGSLYTIIPQIWLKTWTINVSVYIRDHYFF